MNNNGTKTATSEERYRNACNYIRRVSVYAVFVTAAFIMFLIIGLVMQICESADILTLMKTMFLIYYTGLILIVSMNTGFIFDTLRKSETPFSADVTGRMKKLGAVLTIGGALGNLFPIIGLMIEGGSVFTFAYAVNFPVMLVGAVFAAFTYVFEYGGRLQQESDETL